MSSPYLRRRLGAHLPSKVVSAAAARAARMWDWVATARACGVASRAGLRGGRRSGSRMGSRRPCATPGDGIRWRPGVLWPPEVLYNRSYGEQLRGGPFLAGPSRDGGELRLCEAAEASGAGHFGASASRALAAATLVAGPSPQ
ncbi:unnamed protein product [Urochloa humidicola]